MPGRCRQSAELQTPPTQLACAHFTPHAPQSVSVSRAVSQDVPSPSQSANPGSQVSTLHSPLLQTALAWLKLQTRSQAPQCSGSFTAVSQPLPTRESQSA